jgi:hypothetical protein
MANKNTLRDYFPLIRTREEVLADINSSNLLKKTFSTYNKKQQDKFLDYCTGARGVKILYDPFFKEIMNPEYTPERLNDFLSVILNQKACVLYVLPNDSTRIESEKSLLITDLVVQLENGSIINIEVQKIGYFFPGERVSCYSADLLLRQYKRARDEKGKDFSYRDVNPVITIVLYEKSPMEFHNFPDIYIHRVENISDSGVKINLLQNYIFITLDIFKKKHHNKPITNKLDAWLAFFSFDSPEDIITLITRFPEFKPLYEQVYQICQNTEDVMGLFSPELQILDDNTVDYMIDYMQKELDASKKELDANKKELDKSKEELSKALARIKELENSK